MSDAPEIDRALAAGRAHGPAPAAPGEDAPRVRLAARPDAGAETLKELSRDPSLIVRATVALNRACGPEIETILAIDEDDRVRSLLAARIAQLLPNLQDGQGAATHVLSILTALARDEATRVRAAVAHAIKSMDAAPRELVMRLAQDGTSEVSDPVLRLSPVLTDADLLQLIATPPSAGASQAIAGRPHVSVAVADAIVAHADAPAIRTLLANESACIQEATLDALVGRAPSHLDWHAPLVRRPNLSAYAVRSLSEFIAADLLRTLAARTDLDPATIETVRARLALNNGDNDQAIMAEAIRLRRGGDLCEQTLLDAAASGAERRVAALLAAAADLPLRTIDRVAELRSAKGLISLVWKAGFTMQAGLAVQSALLNSAPDYLITPTAKGGFPLSPDEMAWQLELMNNEHHEQGLSAIHTATADRIQFA